MSASLSVVDPVAPQVQMTVDPTNAAGRVSLRPLDHAPQGQPPGGHYRSSVIITPGASAYTAATIVFSLRWIPASLLFVLKRIRASMVCTTTIVTAVPDLQFFKYTGSTGTATNGAGHTTIAPGTGLKNRTSNMASSQNVAMRYFASGTTGLTSDTGRTNDAQPFATCAFVPFSLTAPSSGPQQDVYTDNLNGGHPVILAANEGIEGQFITAQGATSVVKMYLDIEWAEVAAF